MYKKLVEMSRNNDHTTGNLLGYLHHQKYCKIIVINLSRQTNTSVSQQFNFAGKLKEHNGSKMFF